MSMLTNHLQQMLKITVKEVCCEHWSLLSAVPAIQTEEMERAEDDADHVR